MLWVAAVVSGFYVLAEYKSAPGLPADRSRAAIASLGAGDAHPAFELVMVAHPKCPCTRASLAELSRILSRVGDAVRATVIMVRPSDTRWDTSELEARVRAMGEVSVRVDDGAALAERFGAYTSGQVFLYSPSGALLFSGGITSARGHEGDNLGRSTVIKLIERRDAPTDQTDVFGCGLRDGVAVSMPGGAR